MRLPRHWTPANGHSAWRWPQRSSKNRQTVWGSGGSPVAPQPGLYSYILLAPELLQTFMLMDNQAHND